MHSWKLKKQPLLFKKHGTVLSASCFITVLPVDNPTATLPLAKQARTTLMVILVTVLFCKVSPFHVPFSLCPSRDPKWGAGQSPMDTGKSEDISSGHILRLHERFSGPQQKWTLLSVFPKSWVKFSFMFKLLYTPQVQRRGAEKSVSTWPFPILKSIATSKDAKWKCICLTVLFHEVSRVAYWYWALNHSTAYNFWHLAFFLSQREAKSASL